MDPRIVNLSSTTFAGRRFTRKQIASIQETTRTFSSLSRRELVQTVCEHLQWTTPAGKNKIQSCLSALESMEALGILSLPEKDEAMKRGPQKKIEHTARSALQPVIDAPLDQLTPIQVEPAIEKQDIELWNELVERYHYLGYKRPIGPHLRYFVVDNNGRRLGCLLFSFPVKSLPCRDQWIGWQDQKHKKHLDLIVNNNRFLILPWVKVKCLASKALSTACNRLADDWQTHHSYRPVLVETFVDSTKFNATCYRAANWLHLGETNGRAPTKNHPGKTPKAIYVHPLVKDARSVLVEGPKRNVSKKPARPALKPLLPSDPYVQLWTNIIATVTQVANDFDRQWQKRKRVLNTLLIMLFIFRLVFSNTRQGYAITVIELWEQCRTMGIELPQDNPVAPSAFGKARLKLDENIFKELQAQILQQAKPDNDRLWQGHSLFAVDGSKINLPRQLLGTGYETPSDNAYYPQGLVSCLFQLKTKIPVDFDLVSHRDERRLALSHLSALNENDVVVYDRGYYSYELLHAHKERNIHPIFRLKETACKGVREFSSSNETDKIVQISLRKNKRTQICKRGKQQDYPTLAMRLVKYEYGGTTYILGTTLWDQKKYSIEDLSAVYHSRWGVEELYKVSKQLMSIEQFHAHSERGVKQELFAHFVLITLTRLFSNHSEEDINFQDAESEKPQTTINFKNSLITVGRNIEALLLRQANLVSETVNNIIASIGRCRQRLRPGRSYDRCSRKPVGKWMRSKPAKPTAALVS